MDSTELSLQLKKPTGEAGREVAIMLNSTNRELYDFAFEMISPAPGNHILEIGFGNGNHFPEYFDLEPDLKLTGVDFSEDMCEEAEKINPGLIKNGNLTVHCADTTSLPLPDISCDLALALNVIYFMDQPEIHLREIHRVLKPGGLFLIGFRPRHSVEHLEFTRQNFILYEPDELVLMTERCGFNKIREETRFYKKTMPDDEVVELTDCCLMVERTGENAFRQ